MCKKTEPTITALTTFLSKYGTGEGGHGSNVLALYARLFTTGVFQDLCTADNGYYVAIIKVIIAEAGPKSEASTVEALEGVKLHVLY